MSRTRSRNNVIRVAVKSGILVLASNIGLHCLTPNSGLPTGRRLLVTFRSRDYLITSIEVCNKLVYCSGSTTSKILSGCCLATEDGPRIVSSNFDPRCFLKLVGTSDTRGGSTGTFLTARRAVPKLNGNILRSVLCRARVRPGGGVDKLASGRHRGLFCRVGRAVGSVCRLNKQDARDSLFKTGNGCITYLSGSATNVTYPHYKRAVIGRGCLNNDVCCYENYRPLPPT